jgi:hypothetical protein
MVLASGADVTNSNGGVYKTKSCTYVGLQAFCTAKCGDNTEIKAGTTTTTVDVPKDSPSRTCATANTVYDANGVATTSSSLYVYSDLLKTLQCDDDKVAKEPTIVVACADLATCINGGNVTMAFAVIGAIGALFSMVIFAWRMNGDGMCAKLMSMVFSIGTFVSCVVAFSAFQPCASLYYYNKITEVAASTASAKANGVDITNVVVGVAPGVGGIMAVTSFAFFIYVMFMALFIPGANPAAATAGLDKSKV